MLAPSKIRCVVYVAPVEYDRMTDHHPRFRPSDLLPWADPHIRSLVEQLQEEVREENLIRNKNRLEGHWPAEDLDPHTFGAMPGV